MEKLRTRTPAGTLYGRERPRQTCAVAVLDCASLVFSRHAIERMLDRRITPAEVRAVVTDGEIIEHYSDDVPFPTSLVLGMVGGRALHVVLGYDAAIKTGYVVTAYEPDPTLWQSDWKTRRPR